MKKNCWSKTRLYSKNFQTPYRKEALAVRYYLKTPINNLNKKDQLDFLIAKNLLDYLSNPYSTKLHIESKNFLEDFSKKTRGKRNHDENLLLDKKIKDSYKLLKGKWPEDCQRKIIKVHKQRLAPTITTVPKLKLPICAEERLFKTPMVLTQ